MDVLRKLTLAVCMLSVFYTVVSLLAPERFQGQVKTVVSIIIALTIGGILIGAESFGNVFDFAVPDFGGAANTSDSMLTKELEARLAEEIGKILNEGGIPAEKISVETDIDGDNCILISRISLEVNGTKNQYEALLTRIVRSKIGDVSFDAVFTEDVDDY